VRVSLCRKCRNRNLTVQAEGGIPGWAPEEQAERQKEKRD